MADDERDWGAHRLLVLDAIKVQRDTLETMRRELNELRGSMRVVVVVGGASMTVFTTILAAMVVSLLTGDSP